MKTSVERDSTYGEGLAKMIESWENARLKENPGPGPGDYSPHKTFIMRRMGGNHVTYNDSSRLAAVEAAKKVEPDSRL